MDEQVVIQELVFDADYMTKTRSALSSLLYVTMYARSTSKQAMWRVYTGAATITVEQMDKFYQLRGGEL